MTTWPSDDSQLLCLKIVLIVPAGRVAVLTIFEACVRYIEFIIENHAFVITFDTCVKCKVLHFYVKNT